MELLHQFLINQVDSQQSRLAIESKYGDITYGELADRTSKIARWLSDNGCNTQDRVAICLPKRVATVELILAVLYSGAVYVPIDYTAPAQRVKTIVEGASVVRVFTLPDMKDALIDDGVDERLITAFDNINQHNATDILIAGLQSQDSADVLPTDNAAILYTSGSTGIPKGVTLTHQNIAIFSRWVVDRFNIDETEKLSSHAPFHFDLSTMDLYSAFMAGATVYLFDEIEKRFPSTLTKVVQDRKITSWYSVPSALMLIEEKGAMNKRDMSSLKRVFFAGEIYPVAALSSIMEKLPSVEFINLYGPTETNVCTYYCLPPKLDQGIKSIPIGKACEYYRISIVGDDGELLEDGETGEIVVQGLGVMGGYWGDRERTDASQFEGLVDSYRTGDYGTKHPNGNISFGGRKDSQVKIQGYRVELNEIEYIANSNSGVKESVALVLEQDNIKSIYLCVAKALDDINQEQILSWCNKKLPVYALPEAVLVLNEFERTSTGKIDRQKIKQLVSEWVAD